MSHMRYHFVNCTAWFTIAGKGVEKHPEKAMEYYKYVWF